MWAGFARSQRRSCISKREYPLRAENPIEDGARISRSGVGAVDPRVDISCEGGGLIDTLKDGKKIRCTLNGHEFPCNLAELQKFTRGKKYEKLSAAAEFNYGQYEPHVVPSTKQPNQLFCKLTLRHLNRQPDHILRHVNGKRFKKALSKYEECVQQGIEFVPARLKQKKPKDSGGEVKRGRAPKHAESSWEPSTSDEDHSDSEDSMSDLYPPSIFTLKNQAEESMEGQGDKEEDDFQTDEDDEMEVDNQVLQKRKKVQGGGFQKKVRNNHWKSGRKKQKKVLSEK